MSGDRIDLLARIHTLEEENKELKRVNKLKQEQYQEQKKRADKLDKALDKAVSFIQEYPRGFACPYEIDDEDYMIEWSKCPKCGILNGQEIKCWKEWCLEDE